jgi:signal transduction histidine kinase
MAVYVVAGFVSVGRALVRDPFLDPNCWSNCTDNVFLIRAEQGLAGALDLVWLGFSIGVATLIAVVAVTRLLSASRAGRAVLWAVLVPVGLAAGAEAAYAVSLLHDPGEVPENGVFRGIYFARAVALACLAAGVAWTVVRDRRTKRAIARLAADLGEVPRPGSLKAALAQSLGAGELEVAYWLPGSQRYVDATGRPVAPPAAEEHETTPIVRNGQPVALVIHDRALAGAQELEREIGAAARLAVDNERLRAEVLAQLEDLRASRARIIAAGDSTRRRIERNLHDGAQQRLLSLSYELRLARAAAEADGDAELAFTLAASCDEAQAALAELRDLAHGIYPAILTEAGLGPALQTLADGAPLPVEIGDVPDERFAEAVERAAYLVVSGAIEMAPDHAAVTVEREEDAVVVRVGRVGSAPTVHLADRVGALGGSLAVEDGTLTAEIPCA